MRPHNIEKKNLEKQAIMIFLSLFNIEIKSNYRVIAIQECPDALIENGDGNILGLEVTHLFYDFLEAKIVLGKIRSKARRPEEFTILLNGLNELLKKKVNKLSNYKNENPCLLLIRNTSLVFGMNDFIDNREKIEIPKNNFQSIWLVSRGNHLKRWYLLRLK